MRVNCYSNRLRPLILRRGGFTWMKLGALVYDDKTVDVFTRQDFIDAQLHAVKHLLGQLPATFGEFLGPSTTKTLTCARQLT